MAYAGGGAGRVRSLRVLFTRWCFHDRILYDTIYVVALTLSRRDQTEVKQIGPKIAFTLTYRVEQLSYILGTNPLNQFHSTFFNLAPTGPLRIRLDPSPRYLLSESCQEEPCMCVQVAIAMTIRYSIVRVTLLYYVPSVGIL